LFQTSIYIGTFEVAFLVVGVVGRQISFGLSASTRKPEELRVALAQIVSGAA